MMGEIPPPDPLRFGNTANIGSSTGWTDEKHMLYITSLEESFVNQLYNGEVWHTTCYTGNGCNTKVDQGYRGMLETDGSERRSSQTEYLGSPSCSRFQENSIDCYVEYDTSTNYPRQERSSNHAGAKNSGRFAASYLRWDGHSLPRTESSGQNFIDGETEGRDGHSRGCREKQQKQKAGSASSSREGQGRPKQWSM